MITFKKHTISQALARAIFDDDYSMLCGSDNWAIKQWLKGYITLSDDDSVYWKQCEITGKCSYCVVDNQITEQQEK